MSASFAILVSGSPYTSQAHLSAQSFIEALYQEGQEVSRVFFYSDAVYVANNLQSPPNDEPNWHLRWKELAAKYEFKLQACVSVSLKRGLLSAEEAELNELNQFNVSAPFDISGLGEWAESSINGDRVVHFA
ncbi:sulfurtransferase complex subunit TusD [Pleionea sp. CnH1-48]|uniref:sulfurtransferase complex subunit TusD n=1 Tax=Pleionea sp. CnH1-48 TaxID=2954494 RepID=UPI002097508F|nr:sulfurtransferase complex subunit TusD [Pleionea sp. CnH1-48]MCO7222747.1 sulfurtransferase complex subunit TusD [Pleionea sp. CnH1-48]